MIRVADYIMKRIVEAGAKHLFYVPGGQCVYLTDALRRNSDLTGIAVHHEQAAAMAALSYALYNEQMGACLVTTGCAGTNTITGVLHAWQDSIPCIFVSGQQSVANTICESGLPLRQVSVQEADITTIVQSITKYAVMVKDAKKIGWHMDKAIFEATTGRKGPVWLDIPLDIQNAMIDEDSLERYEGEENVLKATEDDIAYVVKQMNEAERSVILAGQGVRSAHAYNRLQQVANTFQVPVVSTRFSVDLLDYRDDMYFGSMGSAGANRYANFVVQNADLLIVVGSRLSIDSTGSNRDEFARAAKIIVVDIDEVEHQKKGVHIDRLILSDAKDFLEQLEKQDIRLTSAKWLETCRHWKEIFPDYSKEMKTKNPIDIKYFLDVMSKKFPENTTITSDAGITGVAAPINCKLKDSDRSITSFAQGEMGFSLPGAIGAACASDGMVFAVTGDGSFMMNLQELQTVVRNHFNIKIIINNNNGYSGVRHGQKAHFRGKSIGTDPSNGVDFPDYGKVAQAFGISYCCIEKVDEIDEKLEAVIQTSEPYICEVMCDPEQFDLHNALVMYGKRKFGFRPIEDQSPFIERDVFFNEMIVEPMETSYGKPM